MSEIKITMKEQSPYTKEFLDNYWHAIMKQSGNRERSFVRQMKPLWDEQEKEVLSRLDKIKSMLWYNETKAVSDVLLPEKATVNAWIRFGKPVMRSILAEVGRETFDRIGDSGFDTLNDRIDTYLGKKVFEFGRELTRTTNDQLKRSLTEGIRQGESIPKLSDRIGDIFDIAKGSRSVTIARTETLGATNFAQNEAYQQSRLVKRKMWVSTRDDRVRTSPPSEFDHLRADGEVVDKSDNFVETGERLRFPLDQRGSAGNVINCRCTTIELFS